ncbi:MAG: hypothetical protein SLAVMIC_00989 [uncultured marine phage]|uniref:Uncharacterized protein n=1 Tax=uncultured marine phage TaxID=707152 RepID=A0A8D9FSK9_9VIRU|nr:MAG: hypothetical protein SLAVMIC_00989 [uncultured marine phage]
MRSLTKEYKKRLRDMGLPLYIKVSESVHNAFNYGMMEDLDFDYELPKGVYVVDEDATNNIKTLDHLMLKGINGAYHIWMFEELNDSEIKSVWREMRLTKLLKDESGGQI